MTIARSRRALRLLVTGRTTVHVNHRRQVVGGAGGQAVLELRVGAGRRAPARGHARGRRRSAWSVPVSMCRHGGLLIGTKQKGHHPVADDGPLSILKLVFWLHHPLALRPPIMARPSSRLLSRTTRRTRPVLAAEAGSDTENVDACDIVVGRVAELAFTCQLRNPKTPNPKRQIPNPKGIIPDPTRHGTRSRGGTERSTQKAPCLCVSVSRLSERWRWLRPTVLPR